MSQTTLHHLEAKRREILKDITLMGDMRRGTVSENYRKCGKSYCHCAEKGSRGHGPQFLWNATIGGKSVAKNLKTEEEISRYRMETDVYRQFTQLSMALVEVNEQICAEREKTHHASETESEKKKR